jgi:tRNA (cytidine/uridine-2'-O-)-methyltransferase
MLHIALFQPEIPPNTGNIIRLCANTGATLHIIKPMAFEWDDKRLRRAGLDYHEFATVRIHENFSDFIENIKGQRLFALSTKATKHYTDIQFQENDCLLFGSESKGISDEVRYHPSLTNLLTIPMLEGSRSLNLSNSASVVLYEAWRQLNFSMKPII